MNAASLTLDPGHWERRWQPLLSQWVVISASSASRPWSGQMANAVSQATLEHDPTCYLCPRVQRASSVTNPDYKGPFAFDNDYPTLSPDAPMTQDTVAGSREASLFQQAPAHGICRVLCWSERHDATLASLSTEQMITAATLWKSEYESLSSRADISQVLIFENKGIEIGVSNLHPHGQVYATAFVTDTANRMRHAQAAYAKKFDGSSLLQDLLQSTIVQEKLIVQRGQYWSVIVPFAARFAFETWIVPHRHLNSLAELNNDELAEFAQLYQTQVRRYDLLFQRSAPNITLLHNAPCDESKDNKHWCFHLAFQPPLRDPVKMKFLAGFESGANNIVNPTQPEHAAEQLRQIDVSSWSP